MLSAWSLTLALSLTVVGCASSHRLSRRQRGLAATGVALLALGACAGAGWLVTEKLLARAVFPPGWLWLGGLAVTCALLLRQRRRAAVGVLCAWLAYTAAGNELLGKTLLRSLERGFGPLPSATQLDAVVVLGGGTDRTPWGAPQLSYSGDRVRVGAELFHAGRTPLLVTTGRSIPGLSQPHQRNLAEETATLWQRQGIPRAAIIGLPQPHNTRTELQAVAQLVRERGWTRVGIVTSAWHLRRAMSLARRFDVPAIPIPADVRGEVPAWTVVQLIPTGSGFYAVQVAFKEYVGELLGR